MRIMVLAWDIPATTNMPGSPRLFNLCKGLSQRHKLALFAFSSSGERYQNFLADPMVKGVFEEIVILPGPPVPTWWRKQIHRLHRGVHFATRHRSPEYHKEQCERICNRYVEGEFDIIYADGLATAQYVNDSKLQCPAIIDLHDSLTLLNARMVQAERNRLHKLMLRVETRSVGRLEKALSRRFGAIITNSKVDEAYLRSLDPSGKFVTIGNGVDSEFFTPGDKRSDVANLVFTGVMNYGPNEDAVVYFCDAILPLIREAHPEVQFWVVGKDPTDKVKVLSRRSGVHITGGGPRRAPLFGLRRYIRVSAALWCRSEKQNSSRLGYAQSSCGDTPQS